jgi:hypothetical protein
MASTITLQQIIKSTRAYAELNPQLPPGGWTQEPALTIANDVMQKILAQPMDWKWNRAYVPAILTVGLQEDYVTQVTNMGWLESADRIDINNSTNNGNLAPKPVFSMESVRDLGRTSFQGYPFNCSFVPNSLAYLGQWYANTVYGCAYGVAQIPITPIQQFMDANGNILYIDSSVLGLNINSPGFTGTPILLPTPNPYGTSGNVQPVLPANSAPGTTVPDGSVTWTVANPNGYAIRVVPLPALSSLAWLMEPIYQVKPPIITSLQQTLAPIPDEFCYLFRQGFKTMCFEHAGSKMFMESFQRWEEDLRVAVRSADREREDATMYPSESLMGGGPARTGMPIGPAWPYEYSGGF